MLLKIMILWNVTLRYGVSCYRRFEGSCSRTPALSEYSSGGIFLSHLHTQPYVTRILLLLLLLLLLLFATYALQPSRLIVRSGLDVPTFATRRLHACHHARAPSGGMWNCGREMFGNFAQMPIYTIHLGIFYMP